MSTFRPPPATAVPGARHRHDHRPAPAPAPAMSTAQDSSSTSATGPHGHQRHPRRILTTRTLQRIHGTQHDVLSRLPLEIGLSIMELLACGDHTAGRSPALGSAGAMPSRLVGPSSTLTLCACALVCRYWARLALDDRVWQKHYARVVARNLFHVDPLVLHPLCDFTSLPRHPYATAAADHDHDKDDQGEREAEDAALDDTRLTDRDLMGLLSARADLGVLDPPALHSLRWCLSLSPHALRDPTLTHRRTLVLDHLMRTTYPFWLAPYPPLNLRWLSKWKYACAVARKDTRRVVMTSGELVRLCFYMHFNDWDNATLTRGGGVFPARLPPTHVSVFCADGQYRTTYYPPDSPIRMHWHWVTEPMDKRVVADPPFVRQVGGEEDEVAWSEDEDESGSDDDDDDDDDNEDDDDDDDDDAESDSDDELGNAGRGAGRWMLQPLMPMGPMTPVAASSPARGHVMPAAMAHAHYPVSSARRPASSGSSWLRPSMGRLAPAHAQFLRDSMFIGRPELPLASTQHHRHRECLLQVDNYLPLTVSRNPDTGQWVMLNRYYMFESLQHPVGPGVAWTAMADQQHHRQHHWSSYPQGYQMLPSYPAPPTYPHY